MENDTKASLNKASRIAVQSTDSDDEHTAARAYKNFRKSESSIKDLIEDSLKSINLDKKKLKYAQTLMSTSEEEQAKKHTNKENKLKRSITVLMEHNQIIKQTLIRNTTKLPSNLLLNRSTESKTEMPDLEEEVDLSTVELKLKAHNIPFAALKRSFVIDRRGVKKFLQPKKTKTFSTSTEANKRQMSIQPNVFDSFISCEQDQISAVSEGCLLIYPDSGFKIIWDLAIFALTLYILVTLPLSMAFQMFESTVYRKLDFAIDLLFIVDFSLNFVIPYQDEEENLICNYRKIAANYLKSWFSVDLLSSIPVTIIMNFFEEGGEDIRFSRFTRLTKLYKLFKFLKVLFIVKVFKKRKVDKKKKVKTVSEDSTETSKEFRLLVSFFIFCIVIHILTCFWIMLATYSEANWTAKLNTDSQSDIYVHSLYFNLATILTVGYGDLVPVSTLERVYSLFMMIFGILTYSFAISQISLIITARDLFTENYIKRVEILESIKREHKITWTQYDKIEKFLNYSSKINKKENYSFIKELLPNVREMLLFNMYETLINNISFLAEKSKSFIVKFIFMMKPYRAYQEEYVLHQGDHVKEMIFIEKGSLSLLLGPKFSFLKVIELQKFESFGDFLIFGGERCPLNIVCKNKQTDLFLIRKEGLEQLRNDFPSEMKQNIAISTYNYMSLVDIIEIKLAKILAKTGEPSDSSAIISSEMILQKQKSFMEINENADLSRVMEEESLAKFSSGSIKLFDQLVESEFGGETKVLSKVKSASKFVKRIEYKQKNHLTPTKFVRAELATETKKKAINTIHQQLAGLRKMVSKLEKAENTVI